MKTKFNVDLGSVELGQFKIHDITISGECEVPAGELVRNFSDFLEAVKVFKNVSKEDFPAIIENVSIAVAKARDEIDAQKRRSALLAAENKIMTTGLFYRCL